jgi:hypothetical protein
MCAHNIFHLVYLSVNALISVENEKDSTLYIVNKRRMFITRIGVRVRADKILIVDYLNFHSREHF